MRRNRTTPILQHTSSVWIKFLAHWIDGRQVRTMAYGPSSMADSNYAARCTAAPAFLNIVWRHGRISVDRQHGPCRQHPPAAAWFFGGGYLAPPIEIIVTNVHTAAKITTETTHAAILSVISKGRAASRKAGNAGLCPALTPSCPT